jgi:hypothetical protein
MDGRKAERPGMTLTAKVRQIKKEKAGLNLQAGLWN